MRPAFAQPLINLTLACSIAACGGGGAQGASTAITQALEFDAIAHQILYSLGRVGG